jgi:hypothetical protein
MPLVPLVPNLGNAFQKVTRERPQVHIDVMHAARKEDLKLRQQNDKGTEGRHTRAPTPHGNASAPKMSGGGGRGRTTDGTSCV